MRANGWKHGNRARKDKIEAMVGGRGAEGPAGRGCAASLQSQLSGTEQAEFHSADVDWTRLKTRDEGLRRGLPDLLSMSVVHSGLLLLRSPLWF